MSLNPEERNNPKLPSEELSVETDVPKQTEEIEKQITCDRETGDKLSNKSVLSTKNILKLVVFVVLIGGISIAAKRLKPATGMAGMEDMKGMSMEDMMRVDGSFNPTPVTVESIEPSLLEASVRYTGSIRPYLELTVYPRVGGQLTEYSAYPGDRVKAGQMLARLSAVELSTEVEEAIAESEAAKAELQITKDEINEQEQEIERMAAESTYLETKLKRTQRVLLDRGAITLNEFDQQKSEATAAKASLRAAQLKKERLQAQIARAEAQLAQSKVKIQRLKIIESYKTISSPIAGIIQERMVDPGVVVEPGMGVLKIGDYSRVRLQANVAQQSLGGIKIGSPIVARVIGDSAKVIKGKITSIFPKAGEETRTVTVEAIVNNPSGQILAGQAVEMQIITASKLNALSIPQTALTEFDGKQAVWVVADKLAKRKLVTTGLVNGDRVEVTGGLQVGEQVISSGQESLLENAQVLAVNDSGQPVASLSNTDRGNTKIQLVSPQGKAAMGDNQLILEVRDSKTEKPMSVEKLEVSVSMLMKNASPMLTDAEVKPSSQPGRFQVNTYLGMRGNWEVTAKVKDKSRSGSSTFTLDNR